MSLFLSPIELPSFFRVRQKFARPCVKDIEATVVSELDRLAISGSIQAGQTIAITCGSRGIANIPILLRTIVRYVRRCGALPFLVPAMGSHGGGTAQGQLQILDQLGITETDCECEIRASMETVVVSEAPQGFPVHFDRHALDADHVIVCGRIKLHTNFHGPIQSGLMKMMLIGLGKHAGAMVYHRAIQDFSFDEIVRSVSTEVIAKCSILCGVAVLENAYEETARVDAVKPDEFAIREAELLELSQQWMPQLPFQRAHLLMIDQIGKEISGTGFDTNVVGRKGNDDQAWNAKTIAIRSLSSATKGNATGIGSADLCRSRVIEQIDTVATRTNVLTAGYATGARIPMDFGTDRELLDVGLQIIGLTPPQQGRVLWIKDTLHLAEIECSQALYEEAESNADLEIISELRPLPLDSNGNLPDDWFD